MMIEFKAIRNYREEIKSCAGMTGSGLGMEAVGLIIHADSQKHPAAGDKGLLEKAFEIGCRRVGHQGSERGFRGWKGRKSGD